MRFRPPPFEITDSDDPFANDTMERRQQIEALTRLVGTIEGPCVLALDAQWGFGKTAFLKMWAQHMRNEGIPVAEFNAWETDFSDDPLMALYATLEDHFRDLPDGHTDRHKQVLKAGLSVVSKVASAALPFVPDLADTVDDAISRAETHTRTRLQRYRDARGAIDDFKVALQETTKESPLVVCVDELDRCRPNYAIEFLEATKHIFEVDGVIFILAVNLSELANSVSALYGNDFDAPAYLRRFVDRSINLPPGNRTRFLQALLESTRLADVDPHSDVVRIVNTFAVAPHVSLRDIEQGTLHMGTFWKVIPSRPRYELYTLAICLVALRTVAPDVYQRVSSGDISDVEALQMLNRHLNRPDDWWKTRYSDHRRLYDEHWIANTYMEVLLIGWSVFTNTEGLSPLLELRRIESQDDESQNGQQYALDIVRIADMVWQEPYVTGHFSYITALVDLMAAD